MIRENAKVFITGASSGIGAALARAYAQQRACVALVARSTALLNSLARDVEEAGGSALAIPADVTDEVAMCRARDEFLAWAGRADVIIANAGIGLKGPACRVASSHVATVLRTNIIGLTNTIMPFVNMMIRQQSGVLVGMGSMAGFRALPWRSVYCASKAAVEVFMDGLRMELVGTGVHAMTICPGFVDTPLTHDTQHRPFLMTADRAAQVITQAIRVRKKRCVLPWQMKALLPLYRLIPEVLFRRLVPGPDGNAALEQP